MPYREFFIVTRDDDGNRIRPAALSRMQFALWLPCWLSVLIALDNGLGMLRHWDSHCRKFASTSTEGLQCRSNELLRLRWNAVDSCRWRFPKWSLPDGQGRSNQISSQVRPDAALPKLRLLILNGASAKLLRHLARRRPRSGARCGAAVCGPRRRDACARSSTRWHAGRLLRSRARPRSDAL